jgi:glycolate oxidase FAD binding subunit
MQKITPSSAEELAEALRAASQAGRTIRIEGNNSKQRGGGAADSCDTVIRTSGLDQTLQYEPKDLTISVGAGMPYARFTGMLAADGMMVPLDPPFAGNATIGGVVAANSSGPRRRLYGTARDLVIGMKFVTVEGKIIQSGGMVVKNVAGLDMAKLLIGSMGTLGAIASVNFKLIPKPPGTRTFLYETATAREAIAIRDRVLQSVLAPTAVDLLNPGAAAGFGRNGWLLALGSAGNPAVLDRFQRELPGSQVLEADEERRFWDFVQEFPGRFLESNPSGAVVRVSTTLTDLESCVSRLPGSVVARAANGVSYACIADAADAPRAYAAGKALMEFGPEHRSPSLVMWPEADSDSGFAIMQKIKKMFDPQHLLNPGRMYGRI